MPACEAQGRQITGPATAPDAVPHDPRKLKEDDDHDDYVIIECGTPAETRIDCEPGYAQGPELNGAPVFPAHVVYEGEPQACPGRPSARHGRPTRRDE